MNFDQFFDSLEQMDQNKKNYQLLWKIMTEYLVSDISFNFTHSNVNLNDYLSDEQLDEISEKYYAHPIETPPKSKVFAIRVKKTDSDEEVDKKVAELQQKIKRYINSK